MIQVSKKSGRPYLNLSEIQKCTINKQNTNGEEGEDEDLTPKLNECRRTLRPSLVLQSKKRLSTDLHPPKGKGHRKKWSISNLKEDSYGDTWNRFPKFDIHGPVTQEYATAGNTQRSLSNNFTHSGFFAGHHIVSVESKAGVEDSYLHSPIFSDDESENEFELI